MVSLTESSMGVRLGGPQGFDRHLALLDIYGIAKIGDGYMCASPSSRSHEDALLLTPHGQRRAGRRACFCFLWLGGGGTLQGFFSAVPRLLLHVHLSPVDLRSLISGSMFVVQRRLRGGWGVGCSAAWSILGAGSRLPSSRLSPGAPQSRLPSSCLCPARRGGAHAGAQAALPCSSTSAARGCVPD